MPESTEPITPKAIDPIKYTIFYGTFIHTPTLSNLEINLFTLVGIDQNGTIDFIYKNNNQITNEDELKKTFIRKRNESNNNKIELQDITFINYSKDLSKFFFPGFIDTHIHASQYPNIGVGLGVPLLDWLKEYTYPVENEFSSPVTKFEFAKLIYSKVIARTLSNGTTCASYFTTIDLDTTKLFADLLLTYGQRGFVGKVCMDHNDVYEEYEESESDCIQSMNELINYCNEINPKSENLIKPIITPRFAPVCSSSLLNTLGSMSKKYNLPIQTHISENLEEIKLVKKLFPESEGYAEVYNEAGLLNNRTILAHAIHLTKKESNLISEKQCSISHCPTSNTFISSGEAPIYKYLNKYNINVSLGTDVSGGFDSSILQMIKFSILVSHHLSMKKNKSTDEEEDVRLSLSTALYMATMGGAKAVGLQDKIGSFDIGKKFDAQLIDLSSKNSNIDIFNWHIPNFKDNEEENFKKIKDLLGKWVFSGDDRNTTKVWCNGRLVIDKS
ncbi:uncharacterized protein KGF55_004945 [Candida pseudojiufengensis]|uniref:uncharacterized protein n=1 Tax=Candida pseudojiufengensis TaxID=497109 RepID=UPI002224F098|nr:uncharacterized protein KGF55_004945 [Candida pseudojiufengensis]KAI5959713.1 hypothetical protein KGF55_004945 [Candida pseudojiufengensis]